MLLTTVFQLFEIDLDSKIDICICKSSTAIDNSSISRLGYELERNQWVLKSSCIMLLLRMKATMRLSWTFHLPLLLLLLPPLLALALQLPYSTLLAPSRTYLSALTSFLLIFNRCTLTIKRTCAHLLATSKPIEKSKIDAT